jgi:cell wall-associated NlpC family hydrolase
MAIPSIPDWRQRILIGVGVKPTTENLKFLDAWAHAEGGTASNNPFNTTQKEPGATAYNSNGGYPVLNYQSAQQGIDATVNTLTNGRYGNIIGALRDGDDAMKAAAALRDSPWGTGALTMKVLGGDPSSYSNNKPAPPGAGVPPVGTGPLITDGLKPLTFTGEAANVGQAPAAQPQTPMERFNLGVNNLLQQSHLAPTSVALMANLGYASDAVAKARTDPEASMVGFDPDNMPVHQTLMTLQSGSTDSKYKSLDLAQDFDGPIHPNASPIVNMAQQFLGTPYLWGGADPRKGFDCSGFVQYLYSQAGIALGRTTYDQIKQGQHVDDVKGLQAGDVVFFQQGGDVHHEGLYIGGGQFIHAPHTGDVVKISSLSDPYYASQFAGGRRFVAPGDAPQTT